jgi:hypothetical protein
MIRGLRFSLLAFALLAAVTLAPRAQAQSCGIFGQPPCTIHCPVCTSRTYTAAVFLGRDANNRCLYKCKWTDTYTDSCAGTSYTVSNHGPVTAGPWENNYCEPAPDPTYFCSYYFGSSC